MSDIDYSSFPNAAGHFGPYGGRFVSETLVHALDELESIYFSLKDDPSFQAEFDKDMAHYVGRPSPLYLAERWTRELGGAQIYLKREDLNHPFVSGNKWWKLKYNLEEAKKLGYNTLLTFGGAHSNHIYATAAAAKETGFKAIGIIRGEELSVQNNTTLRFAEAQGMDLHFRAMGVLV